jgi:hypothetical protein
MNNIEKGGGFTPENKTQEDPAPMSFEEFIDTQKDQDSQYPAGRDKANAYSTYIKTFYHDLLRKQEQEMELYSNYVNDFLRRKQESDPTVSKELLSLGTFISNLRKH